MITNQTIDGVSRELLERAMWTLDTSDGDFNIAKELRALLDATVCSACNDSGRMHEPGCDPGACTACLENPAAKPQVQPVLFVAQDALDDPQCVGMHATRKANALQRVALYAEQPAPVVAVPERLVMTDGLHSYEYVTGHNDAIGKMLGVKP